jgi:phenylalanyl-tRNA synthetase alpha chain
MISQNGEQLGKKGENVKKNVSGPAGHSHVINKEIKRMTDIFAELGFVIANGPELETEFYNFDALNIPADHSSRDMQDTFWVKTAPSTDGKSERKLLRTHTSPVQIRFMQNHKPPFGILAPGKVYRNEATDATHEFQFHQVEGMYINKNVSLRDLKGTLDYFFKKYYGPDVKIRFRPSYFPFVEPGVEIDIWVNGRWLEVMGAGVMHPNVLKSGGIDPTEWSGFAFGMGFDRIVMAKYGIDDVRLLYSGDLRLVRQF